MGQVILAALALVEQHQAAAVLEGMKLSLIERSSLFQATPITIQQVQQARTRQATQLLLSTELNG